MSEESSPALEYKTPRLVRYGTLSELTQFGNSRPGMDGMIYQNPPPPHQGSHVRNKDQ